jgi:hypothetical protein
MTLDGKNLTLLAFHLHAKYLHLRAKNAKFKKKNSQTIIGLSFRKYLIFVHIFGNIRLIFDTNLLSYLFVQLSSPIGSMNLTNFPSRLQGCWNWRNEKEQDRFFR